MSFWKSRHVKTVTFLCAGSFGVRNFTPNYLVIFAESTVRIRDAPIAKSLADTDFRFLSFWPAKTDFADTDLFKSKH